MEDEYRTVEIPGKFGRIRLKVPSRKPTEEELDEYYKETAQILLDIHKRKQKEEMVKATNQ